MSRSPERERPLRAAATKAEEKAKAEQQKLEQRLGPLTYAWLKSANALGVSSWPPLKLINPDRKWSASTMPTKVALQLHLLHSRPTGDIQERLVKSGDIQERFITLSQDLGAVSEGAATLDKVLQTMDALESKNGFCVPEGSLLDSNPFGTWGLMLSNYRALRRQGGATWEETMLAAPHLERFTHDHNESRIPMTFTQPRDVTSSPGNDDLLELDDFSELRLEDTPSKVGPWSSALPSAAAEPEAAQQPPYFGLSTPKIHGPPSTPQHLTDQPSGPFGLGQVLQHWDYEVQASHFVNSCLVPSMQQSLTPEAFSVVDLVFQELGYKYRLDDVDGHVFEARPDAMLHCQDENSERVPVLFYEIKRHSRNEKTQEQIRAEEGGQFVAMLSEYLAAKRVTRPFVRNGQDVRDYKRFMVSFDNNAYWIGVFRFNDHYLDYIRDPESFAYDPGVTCRDHFAIHEEHGPFEVTEKDAMNAFFTIHNALALQFMSESPAGKRIISKLKKQYADLTKDLSPTEVTKLKILEKAHGKTLLDETANTHVGRAQLRRILGICK